MSRAMIRRRAARNMGAIANARPRQSRRTSGVSDWVVSALAVDGTGAAIGAPIPTSFGPTVGASALAVGAAFSFLCPAIIPPPGGTTGTPGIGRQRIDEVRGKIMFNMLGGGPPAQAMVGVAMYVSKRSTAGIWEVRNPLSNLGDAGCDDYLFLDVKGWNVITLAGWAQVVEIDISIPLSVVIGGGEGLAVTAMLCSSSSGGTTALVQAAFRTRVGPVA